MAGAFVDNVVGFVLQQQLVTMARQSFQLTAIGEANWDRGTSALGRERTVHVVPLPARTGQSRRANDRRPVVLNAEHAAV